MYLINNKNDFPVTITIKNVGDFSSWVELEKNNIVVNKNENTSIRYIIKTPQNTNFGNYKSTSIIYIKRKFI